MKVNKIKHGATVAPCFIVSKHCAALFFVMARNDPQMNLRIPVTLKEQIEDAAAENNRTLTAEVVKRLQQSFAEQNNSPSLQSAENQLQTLTEKIELLSKRVDALTTRIPDQK